MSKKLTKGAKLENESTASQVLREILTGSPMRTFLAVIVGFLVGAIFMAAFNPDVITGMSYFFGRPSDALNAIAKAVGDGYGALFRGAIYNSQASDFATAIRPITRLFA